MFRLGKWILCAGLNLTTRIRRKSLKTTLPCILKKKKKHQPLPFFFPEEAFSRNKQNLEEG